MSISGSIVDAVGPISCQGKVIKFNSLALLDQDPIITALIGSSQAAS